MDSNVQGFLHLAELGRVKVIIIPKEDLIFCLALELHSTKRITPEKEDGKRCISETSFYPPAKSPCYKAKAVDNLLLRYSFPRQKRVLDI